MFHHIAVLKKETIDNILDNTNLLVFIKKNNIKDLFFIDVTLGGCGHAIYLIDKFFQHEMFKNLKLHLIAIDKDINAIENGNILLDNKKKEYGDFFDFHLFHDDFINLKELCVKYFPQQKFHGIYGDFGLSSPQLDSAQRGFSFNHAGPIDMRMDTTQKLTAKEIICNYSEEELSKIFFCYGEEPRAKKLAKAIVQDRRSNNFFLENTQVFATYVKNILAYVPNGKTHPATRIFQALRIEVNKELLAIKTLLEDIPDLTHIYAKICCISFHSLEDRLVKYAMRNWQLGKSASAQIYDKNKHNLAPHLQSYLYDNKNISWGKEIPRGGIVPQEAEILHNKRARSARLRIFEFSPIMD